MGANSMGPPVAYEAFPDNVQGITDDGLVLNI